jgi:peptide/nickel transport system permease protein
MGKVARSASGGTGLVLVAGFVLIAALAPFLSPHDPDAIDVLNRFTTPSMAHWMGTDHLGRDLYSRMVYGARIALLVVVSVTAMALTLGTLLGIAAAYAPPLGDRLIRALFDIVSAFPTLVFALAMVAILGPSTLNVVVVVGLTLVPQFGRVARGQALSLKASPYLEAERALGASEMRILRFHLLPNALGPLLVLASMDAPIVITIEAGLSFLGVGVRPPLASWGTLLHDGYTYLTQSPWPVLFAGGALCAATLGFTLLGEALRDALDPRARPLA